jgi:alpha-L-fucosidase
MKFIVLFSFVFILGNTLFAQKDSSKMSWFSDAKLGIFIHWGIYAVDGTSESWSFHNRTTTYPQYMSQLKRFYAENYNATDWAKLIRESGAKYAVITMQHHDGVALWKTKQLTPLPAQSLYDTCYPNVYWKKQDLNLWNQEKPLSIYAQSPAKKDLITPLSEALKKEGIKFGAYYSLLDWSHSDYPAFLKNYSRYNLKNDTIRWNKFLNFMHNQIREINTTFKPDLFWFDGDWEHSESEWGAANIEQIIHSSNPGTIFNGRLKSYGDYATPEQNMPIIHPEKNYWELCLTSNDNWGYRPSDTLMKTTNEVLHIFTECLSMGGNLLLDIGPKSDGTITEEQTNLLKAVGRWTHKHAEAIYGTKEGLPYGHYHGASTLSKDEKTLYLYVSQVRKRDTQNEVKDISLMLKGLKNEIISAEVVGTSTLLTPKIVGKISWSWVPGTVFIDIPENSLDEEITVVKLILNKPLDLYRGMGGFH